MKKKQDTSWGNVADWYDKHLDDNDTYHAQVVLPNLLRVVDLKPDESLLELGCGQGFFLEQFHPFSTKLTGVDLGKELIVRAREKGVPAELIVASADDAKLLAGKTFDVITFILSLQNMKDLTAVMHNAARLLKPNGRVCIVLNHPAFRVPKQSAWEMDKDAKVQYRRVEGYLSEAEVKIDMHPGSAGAKKTFTQSYHRPLQVYMKAFAKEGFAIAKLEEWISHRKSEPGPWAKPENTARKEIPLFMCVVLKRLSV
jgi:ubiquinone/menaquinone biosynthesis C-methylase UbiE